MDQIALIRDLYAAFARGDVSAILAAFDDEIVWEEAEGFPRVGGRHVGVEAVLSALGSLPRDWDAMTVEPQQFFADGDVVVVLGETSGTYRATGRSFATPFAHRWRLRGGRVIGWRAYLDTAMARSAAEDD